MIEKKYLSQSCKHDDILTSHLIHLLCNSEMNLSIPTYMYLYI